VHLIGVHLTGVHLIGVYLMGVHYGVVPIARPQRCNLPVNMCKLYGNFDFRFSTLALAPTVLICRHKTAQGFQKKSVFQAYWTMLCGSLNGNHGISVLVSSIPRLFVLSSNGPILWRPRELMGRRPITDEMGDVYGTVISAASVSVNQRWSYPSTDLNANAPIT